MLIRLLRFALIYAAIATVAILAFHGLPRLILCGWLLGAALFLLLFAGRTGRIGKG